MSALLPHPLTGDLFASPVPPGAGWPEDPATTQTPVAKTPAGVRRLARTPDLAELDARVSVCRACPRLVRWREEVAHTKRASFADEPYWGRPAPGWGSPTPRILIVGLAPAAQGANRTGRVFTGDQSGDWLFASLHRTGLARIATSTHAGDGQELIDTRMVATVRCAPPQNKPTVAERDACSPWIEAEVGLLAEHVRVVVALGSFGWAATLRTYAALGWEVDRPRPRFGHAAETVLRAPAGGSEGAAGTARHDVLLLGCFHPSQHNTFTGRLTVPMTDAVFARAAAAATLPT